MKGNSGVTARLYGQGELQLPHLWLSLIGIPVRGHVLCWTAGASIMLAPVPSGAGHRGKVSTDDDGEVYASEQRLARHKNIVTVSPSTGSVHLCRIKVPDGGKTGLAKYPLKLDGITDGKMVIALRITIADGGNEL